MRLIACAAVAALLSATAASAQETIQTQPPIGGAAATPTTATRGVQPAQVAEWLRTRGGEVTGPTADGEGVVLVVQDGPLRWRLSFYGCQQTGEVCTDVQYGAIFNSPAITHDAVNRWNGERRFLKAHFIADGGEDGTPVAELTYDYFFGAGATVETMADPTYIWISLLPEFVRAIGMAAPEEGAAE